MDPLALLERPDKWFLGGGRTLVYAPPFPEYLQTPGLWDDAHLLDFVHPRPFTWTLLDERDREIPLRWEERIWRPDRLTRVWSTAQGLHVTERACCLRDDALAAEVTVRNDTDRERTLTLVLWTVQRQDSINHEERIRAFGHVPWGVFASREVTPVRRGQTLSPQQLPFLLGSDRNITSFDFATSQINSWQPVWRFNPFTETVREHRFRRDIRSQPFGAPHAVYMAVTYALTVPPHGSDVVTVGVSFAGIQATSPGTPIPSPFTRSVVQAEAEWRAWFAGVPQFECSDSYLTTAYWYRWYGLRLNAIEPPADSLWNAKYPAVCEGIAYFRDLITYSAHVQMRDLRWMHDPAFARGSLRNFLANQNAEGIFPAHLYATFADFDIMYHADWGRALLAVHALHPDDGFLAEVYEPLCRYARYFLTERDREGSHLFDVVNQWETGQEYMHRYTAVDPNADAGGELSPRLKGVDATLYLYNLFVALAKVAATLDKEGEANAWAAHATATEQAILTTMWDAEASMFSDVNAATIARTNVRAAVDFYPFMTLDLGTEDFLRALRVHLLDPAQFWTTYPVPAESASDPEFSAEPFWRGERKNCPWNGRNWPMTTSHVADALATAAQAAAPDLEPAAAHLLHQFVRMMTVDGDPARPNTYEHYHPYNGTASYYRGIDDYMHSYLIDLIVRFVAGFQPRPDGSLVVHPLPMGLEWFTLTDIPYRGHRFAVRWESGAGLTVTMDGADIAFSPTLAPLAIPIADDDEDI